MKKELFSLPNLMGYFRILMIPVFLVLYYHAETPADYTKAFVILAISMLTDLFDGRIARKFHMETELGKALDPIADKLYQFAVALCLMIKFPLMLSVAAILFFKEISMGIMGLVLINKGGQVFGAKWYGKMCTFIIDVSMAFLLLLPMLDLHIPQSLINILIYTCDVVLIFTSMMYTRLFAGKIKALDQD